MSTEPKRPRGRPRKYPPSSVPGTLGTVATATAFFNPTLKISVRQTRQIETIARSARISAEQVLEDVLDQGLLQVYGMYQDLIECRRRLEERKNERFRLHQRLRAPEVDNGASGSGQPHQEPAQSPGPQSNAFDVERGFETIDEPSVASASGDVTVLEDSADENVYSP